eukprot:GHRR01002425.1.p1 GENE.GHRR01002425.1~~GHRR01002425.1.p1  ORF type:complete len:347 (+),score=94.55 GHRR01002425.1:640-1680(+)
MHAALLHYRTAANLASRAQIQQQQCSNLYHVEKWPGVCTSRPGHLLVCQAHPRRVAKVSSQIQREVSEMFIYDKVVQEAICPERRVGLDDKLSAVASITHVYVSNDLQVVKVYVSVYSDERGKEKAINNLKRIAPYVRSRIGQAVRLRLTPEIRFYQDDTLDEMERIQDAIGREDFNRYIEEAEGQPATISSNTGPLYGEDDADNEEDELDIDEGEGYFDIPDADEFPLTTAEQTSTADVAGVVASADVDSSQPTRRSVGWTKHDPETFFAVEIDDEDEEDEDIEQPSSSWYNRGGPFDDLFTGQGDDTDYAVPNHQQQRQQQQQSGSGKPKQQRRKQKQREGAAN